MSFVSKLDRHAGLVTRMADTLGVDLTERAMRGEMRDSEFRGLVLNCVACTDPGACERFLAEHAEGAEAAPHYCRNRDFFEHVKG